MKKIFLLKNFEKQEKIRNKINKIKKMINEHYYYDTNLESDIDKNLNKSLVNLLKDLNYSSTLKKVQNILKKSKKVSNSENIIQDLHQFLSYFWKPNQEITFKSSINFWDFDLGWETTLINSLKMQNFFAEMPILIKEIKNWQPLLSMQICHIYGLTHFPDPNRQNFVGKILAIWYLINYVREQKKKETMAVINSYLEVFNLNFHKYQQLFNEIKLTQNYNKFIIFTTDAILKYEKNWIVNELIVNLWKKKKHFFLAKGEKKFLFLIIHLQLNFFDWKIFKRKTQNNNSKQYIIKNLSNLEKYMFLDSQICKKQKYFSQNKNLKKAIFHYEQRIN